MRDLSLSIGLDSVADDVYFTLVRLDTHADTQTFSADLTKLHATVDATATAHTGLLRGITKADATAIGARADVEAFVMAAQATTLGVVKQDRSDPRFRTAFPDAASTIVTYDEQKLRKWLDGAVVAFGQAAEKELTELAAPAKDLLAALDKAEVSQAAAATANTQHDASVRVPLRNAVNAARRDLYADLTKLATKTKRPKRWVESFFRSPRVAPKAPPAA